MCGLFGGMYLWRLGSGGHQFARRATCLPVITSFPALPSLCMLICEGCCLVCGMYTIPSYVSCLRLADTLYSLPCPCTIPVPPSPVLTSLVVCCCSWLVRLLAPLQPQGDAGPCWPDAVVFLVEAEPSSKCSQHAQRQHSLSSPSVVAWCMVALFCVVHRQMLRHRPRRVQKAVVECSLWQFMRGMSGLSTPCTE